MEVQHQAEEIPPQRSELSGGTLLPEDAEHDERSQHSGSNLSRLMKGNFIMIYKMNKKCSPLLG